MSIFTRLPVSGPPGLPVIPSADIETIGNEFELTAYDHWVFDKAAGSLVGRVNGRLLTPQAGDHPPQYATNNVAINTFVGNGMLSTLDDAPNRTVCVVVDIGTYAGTRTLSGTRAGSGTSGSMLFVVSGNLYGNQVPSSQVGPVSPVPGWQFVALSEGLDSDTTQVLLRGGASPVIKSGGPAKTLASRKVSLGNAHESGGTISHADLFAEFILYDRALSADELAAVYERSKARMERRGIVVA